MKNTIRWVLGSLCLWALGGFVGFAQDSVPVIQPRLVPVEQGNFNHRKAGPSQAFDTSPMVQAARRLGLDPLAPNHSHLMHALRNDRLFYLFYNDVIVKNHKDAYLIQRIHKQDVVLAADSTETTSTTYQVEAFKPVGGKLKRSDQHFGYFKLRDARRRTITKVFDVGIGSVADTAAVAGPWPFDQRLLFQMMQPYQAAPELYDKVKFTEVQRWTFRLSFDSSGNYELEIPELGVHVLAQVPESARVPPAKQVAETLVLLEGQGLADLRIGVSRMADIQRTMGKAKQVTQHGTSQNLSYDGITFNLNGAGLLNTVFTTPGFAGKTARGASHGETLEGLRKIYGDAGPSIGPAVYYKKAGILFQLGHDKRVEKIVVTGAR